MKKICKSGQIKCIAWNDGEGSRICLKCPIPDEAGNNHHALKEDYLGENETESLRMSSNYNGVIYENYKAIEMHKRFKSLSKEYKAVIALHLCEFSYRDIARLLHVSHVTARKIVLSIKD